jgi:hypothetical protein
LGVLKVIYLVISLVPKGESLNGWPDTQEFFLKLPTGTTLEECRAEHKPAADLNTEEAQMFTVKCVELDLLPASKA